MTDPAELRELYSDVPAAHIYALVDLEEPFWSTSHWYRRGDAVVGIVSLPDEEGLAVYAVSTRDPAGSLELVTELAPAFSSGQLITGPTGLADALRPQRELAWDGPHLRYVLDDRAAVPAPEPRVLPLGPDDRDELAELYASEPGAAFFLPHMVDDASFVGIVEDGDLVAAAGTHVLSDDQRVAAIGSVYTRPSHRGRGLGRAATAGVIHRIAERIDVIGLNVAADNAPARAIYETMGFTPVLAYDEAEIR